MLFLTLALAQEFPQREVIVNFGHETAHYSHPGGVIDEQQIREFCKERLEAALKEKGIQRTPKQEAVFDLLENLWGSCRDELMRQLPEALNTR